MPQICLVSSEQTVNYPSLEDFFSPSECYPEYPFDKSDMARKSNEVYSMIRELFICAGYDKEHIGTKEWNPLGKYIKSGDYVLIKPNWVEEKNKNIEAGLECLITNPSVVRVIIDYVVIALKGSGTIMVADAPMQGCNLPELMEKSGYNRLFDFYRSKNVVIETADLRKYHVVKKSDGTVSAPILTESKIDSVVVDLQNMSMHAEKDFQHPKYKVSDYKQGDTGKYHQKGHHCYEVSEIPLRADFIINVPKPKTHRLAGMTAAQKNFVGITYEKASLPHRIEGAKCDGGDEYLKRSLWKRLMTVFDERKTAAAIENKKLLAKTDNFFMKLCYVIGTVISGDRFRIGSWYGNDTIWRTIVDLNRIVLYADIKGKLHDKPQRKILTIGDMIICGEKEGPVSPSPKILNMIMMSDNCLLFDRVMCEIMGFDYKKFACFNTLKALSTYGFTSTEELNSQIISWNSGKITVRVSEFVSKDEWKFASHTCWKGYI